MLFPLIISFSISILWREAEGVGVGWPGEEEAPGRPYSGLPVPKEAYRKAGDGLCVRGIGIGQG